MANPTTSKSVQAREERFGTEYNMCHQHRGSAFIFYHENFKKIDKTLDTKDDCIDLENALKNLNFDVTTCYNFKVEKIISTLKKVAKDDQRKNDDCIVIAILTHGENDYLRAYDSIYKLTDIANLFTADECPNLAEKPKLFIIDAARGNSSDPGFEITKRIQTDGSSNGINSKYYTIPIHADFLFAYSTIPNYLSWRNDKSRSWFLQSLVAELNSNGKNRSLLHILTSVNRRVALGYQSNSLDPEKVKLKQIPCFTSMLTRIVRFNDKRITASN